MTWSEFRSSLQYIRASVAEEYVDEFIRANKFREKVYMVTGVMIASGAAGMIHSMRKRGLYVHLGVKGTIISSGIAPISAGTKGDVHWGNEATTSFSDPDDFVFAFRLRQIKIRKTGEIVHKPKVDGALFGLEDGQELLRKRTEDENMIEVIVEGMAEEEATGLNFRLGELKSIDIRGQECLYVSS